MINRSHTHNVTPYKGISLRTVPEVAALLKKAKYPKVCLE
jgi:hypothetical protein